MPNDIDVDFDPHARFGEVPSFTLTSDDVAHGQPLRAAQYAAAAGGDDVSPQLSWSRAPEGTRSFAVTCYDPDAPTGSGYWHWAVFDIPASVTSLPSGAGAQSTGSLPEGAVTLPNESRSAFFQGANPPDGTGVHRYLFIVHAVDVEKLGIDPSSTPAALGFNLHFHALGRAQITGTGIFGGATR
ncbi:YbhB/YbcL family Raf kinase inhibitor-like protein [Okibacterium endophyticum]